MFLSNHAELIMVEIVCHIKCECYFNFSCSKTLSIIHHPFRPPSNEIKIFCNLSLRRTWMNFYKIITWWEPDNIRNGFRGFFYGFGSVRSRDYLLFWMPTVIFCTECYASVRGGQCYVLYKIMILSPAYIYLNINHISGREVSIKPGNTVTLNSKLIHIWINMYIYLYPWQEAIFLPALDCISGSKIMSSHQPCWWGVYNGTLMSI